MQGHVVGARANNLQRRRSLVYAVVNNVDLVCLAGRQTLAGEILGGQQVAIRIDAATLSLVDPATRRLLRTRPNPLTLEQVRRLRGARPIVTGQRLPSAGPTHAR